MESRLDKKEKIVQENKGKIEELEKLKKKMKSLRIENNRLKNTEKSIILQLDGEGSVNKRYSSNNTS